MSAPAWVVTASGDHIRTTAEPGSRLVAELLGRDRATREQDGAIIAAAPALLALCRAFYSAELDEHFRAGEPEPWECDRAERLSEARPLLESLSRLGA